MGTKQSESGRESEGDREGRESGSVHNAITGAAVSGMEQRREGGRGGGSDEEESSNSHAKKNFVLYPS